MKNPHAVQNMVRRRVRRRRMWRRLRVATFVVGGLVAIGGAAFGVDRMVVSLHRYYSSGPHAPTTTTTAPVVNTTTTTPGPGGCVGGQLTGTVPNFRTSRGTTYEIIQLTNVSLSPCRLEGYPLLAVNSSNGTALPAATQDVAALGTVSDSTSGDTGPGVGVSSPPGAGPVPVTIGPRERTWFELSYSARCDQVLAPGAAPTGAANLCYAGSILQVTPPHTASPLLITEPVHFTYGIAGFEVGPFEPGLPPRSIPIPS
jgi:hypothetical protein